MIIMKIILIISKSFYNLLEISLKTTFLSKKKLKNPPDSEFNRYIIFITHISKRFLKLNYYYIDKK